MKANARPYRMVWNSRNLATLAVAQTASALSFYVPVSALFLTSRGLSFSEIFMLESILLASIFVAEIPAGVISDRVDRRWTIICGYCAAAVAEVLFAAGHSFAVFAVSFILSGLGIALLSGVEDAYVYESLGDEADAKSVGVWGHLASLGLVAGVLASIVGGWTASYDLAIPAILSAITAGLAAVAAFFIPPREPVVSDEEEPKPEIGLLRSSIRLTFTSPVLLYVSLAASTGYVVFNAVYTLNQPLYQASGIPLKLWGILAAGSLILAAIYAHNSDLVEKHLGRKRALFVATAAGGIGFLLMAAPHAVSVIAGFALVIIGMNARGPIMGAVANKIVPSYQRSTVLSVMSSFGSLVGIAVNPAIGWGADRSPALTAAALGVVLLLVALSWLPIAARYVTDVQPDAVPELD